MNIFRYFLHSNFIRSRKAFRKRWTFLNRWLMASRPTPRAIKFPKIFRWNWWSVTRMKRKCLWKVTKTWNKWRTREDKRTISEKAILIASIKLIARLIQTGNRLLCRGDGKHSPYATFIFCQYISGLRRHGYILVGINCDCVRLFWSQQSL